MIESNYQIEECKNYFFNLLNIEDWESQFNWADNKPNLNGTNGYIRYKPYDFLTTEETKYLFEENQCFWFRDIIFNLTYFFDFDKSFLVWYLFVNENNEGIIICDNGNYEPIFYFKIPFTDFKNYGSTSLKLFFENNTLYIPMQR